MGISGLLPALNSISTQKHLSEFAGQTLAVDAYVWLHRGVFTCATELATGKDTHKYVDYAMHRIRLLRHHKIEPYVVFDGGPLPAKKGTEVDRQAKRTEHLALGKALAAQGKTAQAREHYVKCVDVTPQMAFQFIKALRAEGVSYVVAPYEADAQLAHLERVGLVDGIITEDSDLLVFGCRKVLFKMDAVSSTAVCIDRADFGSVSTDGITLAGWSDAQFRAMAILSGCDYLPSINGIGLKTACTLLRKWKTVEQVLRAIALEGKKSIPRKYLQSFRMAEKCFKHQRVYCPLQQKLVHLSEPDADWDEEADAYVGADIEPAMAKMLGEGDLDPVTLLPMTDINPRYVPRVLKPLPIATTGANRDKGKGKASSILNFFGPAASRGIKTATVASPKLAKSSMIVGKASGKRTLAAEMEYDLAAKRKKRDCAAESRFFSAPKPLHPHVDVEGPSAGPSSIEDSKENVPPVDLNAEEDLDLETDLEADLEWDSLSLVAAPDRDQDMKMMEIEEPEDGVQQEEGYISPTPSRTRDCEDLSSPVRGSDITPPPKKRIKRECVEAAPDFEVDAVSSPPEAARGRYAPLPALALGRSLSQDGAILVDASPDPPRTVLVGPDLRDVFDDARTSDIDCFEDEDEDEGPIASGSTPTPTPTPPTPDDDVSGDLGLSLMDPEELEAHASAARAEAVAAGWRNMWANTNKATNGKGRETPALLRRRETNVTPAGRHFPVNAHSRGHPYLHAASPPVSSSKTASKPLQSRQSLTFLDPVRPKPSRGRVSDTGILGADADEVAVAKAKIRLAQYRFS